MNKTVQPAGNAKTAIAELQGRIKTVVTGATASTVVTLPGVLASAFLFSVIGFDGDAVALADQVKDFTATSSVVADDVSVLGVTLVSTDPVSVGATAHGLATGDYVMFDDTFVGTTELNDTNWIVDVTDANNFTLRGSNSANFTAWTSGGILTTKNGQLVCTDDTSAYQLVVETYAQPNV